MFVESHGFFTVNTFKKYGKVPFVDTAIFQAMSKQIYKI